MEEIDAIVKFRESVDWALGGLGLKVLHSVVDQGLPLLLLFLDEFIRVWAFCCSMLQPWRMAIEQG